MSKAPKSRKRRLNVRALVILAAVLVMALPGAVALQVFQQQRSRTAYLREAKDLLAQGRPDLALSYLNRYLELNPRDVEALTIKGNLLADKALLVASASEPERKRAQPLLAEAANVLNQVMGLQPGGSGNGETLRRLIRLNLLIDNRAAAADTQSAALLASFGKDRRPDAEALRLRARALEEFSKYSNNEKQNHGLLQDALKHYEEAEALDPGDADGALALALLFRNRLDDPAQAAKVLDRLVKGTAGDPKKHAAAFKARSAFQNEVARQSVKDGAAARKALEASRADIEEAARFDPTDVVIRLKAIDASLLVRDNDAARRHLAAIPAGFRGDLPVRLREGMVDLQEKRRDAAIETWRAGLVKTGGTDAELTWRLASVLLESGRIDEAKPLLDQFRRLVGGEEPGPRYQFLNGYFLLKSNRPAEAIAVLEKIRFNTDTELEPSTQFVLGQAYEMKAVGQGGQEKQDSLAKAMDAYRRGAALAPEWSAPALAIAGLLKDTRPDEAVSTLRQGLAMARATGGPPDAKLLADLVQLLIREQARKPAAQRSWDAIERLIAEAKQAAAGPSAAGAPEIILVEADFKAAIGRWEEAVGLLETACRLRPAAAELWIALANAAYRRGHLGRALEVLDQAIAKAGPRAEFYNHRATVLATKGEVSKSAEALTEGLTRVPIDQRWSLWKSVGDLAVVRHDLKTARSAFQEWSKLRPEESAPEIALVDVAIASGDEPAIAAAIEGLRGVGGPRGYYWKYARFEDLLRSRAGEPPDPARDAKRLAEAQGLVDQIKADSPVLALGVLLEGRLREREGKTDEAIKAYKEAVRLGGQSSAVRPLTALLVREKRDRELDLLRDQLAQSGTDVEQIAAMEALRQGNRGKAEQLAALAAQGNAQGVDLPTWQAGVLQALGKPKEAEASLEAVLKSDPGDLSAWLQLLMLRVSLKRTDAAAAVIDKMKANLDKIRAKPRYQSVTPELLWGQCYRAVGDLPRAVENYQEAVQHATNDPDVLVSAVSFYQQAGMRKEAEDTLRSILGRNPGNAWATRQLALSRASHLNDQPSWEEGLKLVGPEPGPNDVPDDTMTRARVYAVGPLAEHRRKAITILEGLTAELPDLAPAQELLARLLDVDGRPEQARGHAAKAAEGDRAGRDAIVLYAGILLRLKEYDAADAQLDRIARTDPDNLPLAEQRARVLVARGKPKEAAAVMEKAFGSHATGPEAAFVGKEIAKLLREWGQPEAADRVALRVAELSTWGRCVLAEQLAADGKLDEAAKQLDEAARAGDPDAAGGSALALALAPQPDPRWLALADRYIGAAVKLRPGSATLLEKQGLVRHLQGKFDEEVALYKTILALEPGNFEFLNNMAWTLAQEMNRPEEGLKWADEAVRKAGPRAAILDTRGVIHTRLKRHDDAIRDLEAAVREAPVGPFLFHLARAYLTAGKPDDARKAADRARQAGLKKDQLQRSELDGWDAVMGPEK